MSKKIFFVFFDQKTFLVENSKKENKKWQDWAG